MGGQYQGGQGGMPFGPGFGAQPGQPGLQPGQIGAQQGQVAAQPAQPESGVPAAATGTAAAPAVAGAAPMNEMILRAHFGHQLPQLLAMGFTNESRCLQVLQQQNGRIDAAIDVLLADG